VQCPHCQNEELVSKVSLFLESDLTEDAEQFVNSKKSEIAELKKKLLVLQKTKLGQIKAGAKSSNFGKLIEKFAPLLPGFKGMPEESIPLLDPIDFLVFDGLLKSQIECIRLIDVKSGNGRLSEIQKTIKSTLESGKIELTILKRGAT
jgi:predicted Holliday junction resolvase-like endonuclease